MGLFFTLLYILSAYLGPQTMFGSLADYHVAVIIAVLALLTSILSIQGSDLARISQSYSLFFMCIAVFLSFISNGLFGLAPLALLSFVPNAFIFYLIILNCKKKAHLQLIVLVLLFACVFTLVSGVNAANSEDWASPYLLGQRNDAGERIIRIRGLAFINDPNDYAQLMVSLIPCMFFFWKEKKIFRNIVVVLVPVSVLVYAMYLTHSRGAIVSLLAVTVFAARRKLGTLPSVIGGGVLFIISTAVGWSGGRDISVEAGSDRLEAWSVGLQFIRSHPFFGIGFERFSENYDITAHNTVVVCAAELGFFGLFFWVMYVLPTFRDTAVASKLSGKASNALDESVDTPVPAHLQRRAAPAVAALHTSPNLEPHVVAVAITPKPHATATPYYMVDEKSDVLPEGEIGRLANIMTLALLGYFVAGWFLSRAYVMTLFIYVGMAEVLYSMALNQGLVPPRMETTRLIRITAITSVGLIALVYIMLRIQRMMPH